MASTNEWLNDVFEELEEMISCVARFKTKSTRKEFFGEIRQIIQNSVEKNTSPKTSSLNWREQMTHPKGIGVKSDGFSVMTEALSSSGDQVLKSVIAKNSPEGQKKEEEKKKIEVSSDKKKHANRW